MAKLKLMSLIILLVMLSACSTPLPKTNYDLSKNTQQQFDKDQGDCEMLMDMNFGSQLTAPMNFVPNCMRSKGWHF
jgi:hypothetical protein